VHWPQLVHWWVLGHSSLFSIFFYIIFSLIFISFFQFLNIYINPPNFHSFFFFFFFFFFFKLYFFFFFYFFFYSSFFLFFFFFFFQFSICNPNLSFQSMFSASSFEFLFFKAYLCNGSHYCEKGYTNLDVISTALGNCAFFKSWSCNFHLNNDPLIGSPFLPFLCAILSRKKYSSCL